MSFFGGFGLDPFGRDEFGNAASAIEPRFEVSSPVDNAKHVLVDKFLKFTTYCYSSTLNPVSSDSVKVEISENKGWTYTTVFANDAFALAYATSKYLWEDGHRLAFFIKKATNWAPMSHIIVRVTAVDEYGNMGTKTTPVIWPDITGHGPIE